VRLRKKLEETLLILKQEKKKVVRCNMKYHMSKLFEMIDQYYEFKRYKPEGQFPSGFFLESGNEEWGDKLKEEFKYRYGESDYDGIRGDVSAMPCIFVTRGAQLFIEEMLGDYVLKEYGLLLCLC
jgi:hypothetical protein